MHNPLSYRFYHYLLLLTIILLYVDDQVVNVLIFNVIVKAFMVNLYFNLFIPIDKINLYFTIFIAYILFVILCHALRTMPNEPEPNGFVYYKIMKSFIELK